MFFKIIRIFARIFLMTNSLHHNCPPASLIRQLAAMFYDSLLIFAILFVVVAISIAFNQGEAIENRPAIYLIIFLVVLVFYGWFWSKSGQTLGMKVWKIRIVCEPGGNPDWSISFLRIVFAVFSIACLGLGYWWRLFKPYTWHDRLSQTKIVDVSSLPVEHR